MQKKCQPLAIAIALGLAVATPGLAQPQPTEPTRPPERVAPSAAPTNPGTSAPAPGMTTPMAPQASTTGDATRAARPAGSTTATPEPGANSFTEAQARSRIEAAGFTQVANLRKQDDGIWRGQAMRGGMRVNVMLDFRGDVSAQQ